jgi:hypothetical protein
MKQNKEIDPYDEEIWEEEVDDVRSDVMISLGDDYYPINMNMKFEIGVNRISRYGMIVPGPTIFEKEIEFLGEDRDKAKNLLLEKREKSNNNLKKIDSLTVENYDKNGILLRKINLYGISVWCNDHEWGPQNNEGYKFNLMFDYWQMEYL